MSTYVALDVSLQSTSMHIVDQHGRCVWRGKCATDVDALTSTIEPFFVADPPTTSTSYPFGEVSGLTKICVDCLIESFGV